MLPVLHPLHKTEIDLKRSIQRLEIYIRINHDEKAIAILQLLKQAYGMIDHDSN